jgi:hypothetical protein
MQAVDFAITAEIVVGEQPVECLLAKRHHASVAAAGWRGLAAGKPVVVSDLLTQNELQTIRVLPWQVIARASQSRNR